MAWALGAWHASFLLAAFMAVAHAAGGAGGLTAAIGTMPGLAAFAWLWSLTWWTAYRVLETTDMGQGNVAAAVGAHGAMAGSVFVLGLGIGAIGLAFLQERDPAALFGLVFVLIAAVVAALPGAVVGWLLMGIDSGLAQGLRLQTVSPDPGKQT